MSRPARTRAAEAGLTLVEMLVALAIFAIIGAAAFAVLDQVVRAQRLTENRLARLAELQRAVYVVTQDLTRATGGSLRLDPDGLRFRRSSGQTDLSVRYDLRDGTLLRSLSTGFGGPVRAQRLLTGVQTLTWQFRSPEGTWVDRWPIDPTAGPMNPVAVALDLRLAGPTLAGDLRRVAILPAEAEP